MKKALIILLVIVFSVPVFVFAGDVNVRGYYRKDGTYVRPHIRSSPDQYKHNNYGPSTDSSQLMNPKQRDWDRDGTPNYLDKDDDNDRTYDDQDKNQYSTPNNRQQRQNYGYPY
jgi:hypothetical protein